MQVIKISLTRCWRKPIQVVNLTTNHEKQSLAESMLPVQEKTRKDAEEELFGESYSDIDDTDEETSNTRPTSVTYVYDDDSSKARPSSITYVYEDDKQQNRPPSVSYVYDD